MELRPLTSRDISYMEQYSRDKDFYKEPMSEIDYMYALDSEGEVLMIGGFRMITNQTAWCWMDLSLAGLERIYTCYRVIKEWIEKFCKRMNISRLEACVEEGHENGVNLVTHLGFKFESRKPRFFGKNSADLYVRFFGGD